MNDTLPDHAALTRLRQRCGADRFRRIFARIMLASDGALVTRVLDPDRANRVTRSTELLAKEGQAASAFS